MFNLLSRTRTSPTALLSSQLFDDKSFYPTFLKDLAMCRNEAIIESPFITTKRINTLLPVLQKLRRKGVKIIINTRDPIENDVSTLQVQATEAITHLQSIGIQVLYTDSHHRKLAILDSRVLWEGSLNILSQSNSCEIMRRIESRELAQQMITFIKLNKFVR